LTKGVRTQKSGFRIPIGLFAIAAGLWAQAPEAPQALLSTKDLNQLCVRAGQLMEALGRFGSVTVLNGHIHQIVQKVEGHVTFHTARSTAYPQPLAGVGEGPGPLKVAPGELPGMLGISSIEEVKHPRHLRFSDRTLAGSAA